MMNTWKQNTGTSNSCFFDMKGGGGGRRICICCLEHIHTHSHTFMGMCHRQLACTMCHFSSVSQSLSSTLSLHFLLFQTPILFISGPRTGTQLDATGAFRSVYPGAYSVYVEFYTRPYPSCKHWCAALHQNQWRKQKRTYKCIPTASACKSTSPTANCECANTNDGQISHAISFQSARQEGGKKNFIEIHTIFFFSLQVDISPQPWSISITESPCSGDQK